MQAMLEASYKRGNCDKHTSFVSAVIDYVGL
jgi:hypothetical protein